MGVAACFMHVLFLLSMLQSKPLPTAAQSNSYDYSYMKSVKNATEMPLVALYDYIVVGGGTAGCPLAATLSANYSVLVLERGGVPLEQPDVLSQANFHQVLAQDDNGSTPAQKFTSEDGVENWRGRILGGTSMINNGYFSRADPEFYPLSGINWEMGVVEDSYRWVEGSVAYFNDLQVPWNSAAKEGLLQAGVTPDNGFTVEHLIGTKASASTFDTFSRRFGAVELLNKARLANLQVAVRATVERIIFLRTSSGLAAREVTYKDSTGRSHRAIIHDKGEIIISAGHIGSPQLLLLSGIGPKPYLSSLGIPTVSDHPFVGKEIYDNPFTFVTISSPIPLNTSLLQIVGILPNYTLIQTGSKSPNLGALLTKVARLASVGNYTLESPTDVKVPPKVRYNYFTDPSDVARCVTGVRKVGEVLDTLAFDKFKFVDNGTGERGIRFVPPVPPLNGSDADLGMFCRSFINTTSHYHGGCLVGKVVDGDLRVKGIGALRVVDASVIIQAPGTNPQATIMMLGRYIGLRMLKERMAARRPDDASWCYSEK